MLRKKTVANVGDASSQIQGEIQAMLRNEKTESPMSTKSPLGRGDSSVAAKGKLVEFMQEVGNPCSYNSFPA